MQKELTITIHEDVYDGLFQAIGSQNISRFIEDLVRPYILYSDLDAAYPGMLGGGEQEVEALQWAETMLDTFNSECPLS